MQRVTLLCIGKLKEPWAREACARYAERLRRMIDLSVVEFPASKTPDARRQRAEESARMLDHLQDARGEIWVFDERGKDVTSIDFSKTLARLADAGTPLTLVLGGAYGLDDAVRSRGTKIVRLSAMTLPHELCRVLLLEQLYRACDIARGGGYHH